MSRSAWRIEGLAAGQHTIHLNYDFLTGGSEAYDFLATWNVTENPNKCADPSAGGRVVALSEQPRLCRHPSVPG